MYGPRAHDQNYLRARPQQPTLVVYSGGIIDEISADDKSTKTFRLGDGWASRALKAGAPGPRLGVKGPDIFHLGVGQRRASRQGRLHC